MSTSTTEKKFDFLGVFAVILAIIAIGGVFFCVLYLIEKSNTSQKETLEVVRESHQKTFETILSVDNTLKDHNHQQDIAIVKLDDRMNNVEEKVDKGAQEAEKIKEELERERKLREERDAELRRIRSQQAQTHTARTVYVTSPAEKDVQPSPETDRRAQFRANLEDAIFDVAEKKIQEVGTR